MELEDRVTIATPEGLPVQLQLADLGSRFIAFGFDLALQLVIIALVAVVAFSVLGGAVATSVFVVSLFAVIWFYHVLFEVLAGGRTPGKRLTHLRVVRDDGAPVDLPASAVRNLLRVVDLLFFFLPAMLSILFTRRHQRVGDLAAGTLVIRDAPRMSPSPSHPLAPSAAPGAPASAPPRPAAPLDVSAVTVAEVAAVRRFLARRDELDREARQRLAYRLEGGLRAKVAGAPPDPNPERFLEALVAAKARV